MGFIKFLKRDKSKDLDLEALEDLDVPPAPPDFGETRFEDIEKGIEELPELPEIPEFDEAIPEKREKQIPELKLPSIEEFQKPKTGIKFTEIPRPPREMFSMEGLEEKKPRVEIPKPRYVEEAPRPAPGITPYERLERSAVREEKGMLRHEETKGPVFIRVDKFRNILTGTSAIRNDLRIASKAIAKLNEIDENRGKVLEKWRNAMTDLQKKLIFIDKTFFKR